MKSDKTGRNALSRREFVKGTAAGAGAVALATAGASGAQDAVHRKWDHQADVVIIGSGATGLPAAIEAREQGASVIVVEANFDVGGHAILSGGNVALGGGNSRQKKYGIVDSAGSGFLRPHRLVRGRAERFSRLSL